MSSTYCSVGQGTEISKMIQDAILIHTLNIVFRRNKPGKFEKINQHLNLIHMLNVLLNMVGTVGVNSEHDSGCHFCSLVQRIVVGEEETFQT